VSYEPDSNPYAAPAAGAEAGGRRAFSFTDEVRKLIATTALLMIIGGSLQMIPGVSGLILNGFTAPSLVNLAIFGVVPAFVVFAGFSLRGVSRPGDDLGALMSGFRQLFVAFLIKGIVMLTVVGVFLLGFLLSILGVGAGLFNLFS
jgi:hypothetical protein